MNLRLDRVTRMLALGFKKLYSLVLDDKGLYVIRTGNVGALMELGVPIPNPTKPGSVAGTALGMAAAGKIIGAFGKELLAGEERLSNTTLDQLAKEKDNAFVSLAEIQSVTSKATKTPDPLPAGPATEMKLKTAKGDFTFIFTHNPPDQVQALEQALSKRR